MDRASPLEIVVRRYREGRSDIFFPEGGEGLIIRLMDEGEVCMRDLEASQKPIVPGSEIDIRIGYKGGRKSKGREGIGVGLGGIRHTMDRRLVCQQNQYLVVKVLREEPLLRFSL